MQIDLNEDEIKTLCSALEAWEKETAQNNMLSSLLGVMLAPPEQQAKVRAEGPLEIEKGSMEAKVRRTTSIMLQAKLLTAANKQYG